MKKLETLTTDQEAYIPVLRKKWEDVFYKNEELDMEGAKKYIGWLYKRYLNQDQPIVMSMKSPLGCQILISVLKDLKMEKANLRDNLGDNLGDNLRDEVGENRGENRRDNLRDNHRDNVS
ncbi:MAG: hypothetical protein AB3N18_06980 [Allomuricauda sp.]